MIPRTTGWLQSVARRTLAPNGGIRDDDQDAAGWDLRGSDAPRPAVAFRLPDDVRDVPAHRRAELGRSAAVDDGRRPLWRAGTTAVRRFEDGDGRWLIVGSAGGRATQPAWLHNLAAHPDQAWIEIGHDTWKVRPELIEGVARDDAWKRIVAEAPQFGKYETTTDREIAVVRLTREG